MACQVSTKLYTCLHVHPGLLVVKVIHVIMWLPGFAKVARSLGSVNDKQLQPVSFSSIDRDRDGDVILLDFHSLD